MRDVRPPMKVSWAVTVIDIVANSNGAFFLYESQMILPMFENYRRVMTSLKSDQTACSLISGANKTLLKIVHVSKFRMSNPAADLPGFNAGSA
jgi:hypothetical protein